MDIERFNIADRELALSSELKRRRAQDSLRTFEPFSKQRAFIQSVLQGKHKENYYVGANRSGKSDAGAYCGAYLARFGSEDAGWASAKGSDLSIRDRATSGWVSALDFPTSRDTLQPKYFDNGFVPAGVNHQPFIPDWEIEEWRVSDQVLKLKNGSLIGFRSAESGRAKYQGAEKDWIHFDEEHPESIFEESVIRVGARPLKIFTTCTLLPPEGSVGGVTWVFNKIIKPWLAMSQKEREESLVGVYNASIYDNPHIPKAEIQFLESKYPEGSTQNRIRLKGELIAGLSGARIYSGFDARLNQRPQPEIALRRPLAWIWDFNVEPMISIIGQKEQNLFRVYRELLLEEGNLQEMCELFRSIHPFHLAEIWIYGDASGKDRSHQSNMSSYQIILNAMTDYAAPCKLRVPEKNPPIANRINAVNRACKHEDGEVCLEIDPTAQELIDDLEQVLSDGRGGIKKTTNKRDPYYRRTHMSDALGYWIAYEAPVEPIKPEHAPSRFSAISIKDPGYRPAR